MKGTKPAYTIAVIGIALFVVIAVLTLSGLTIRFDRAAADLIRFSEHSAVVLLFRMVTYTASVVGTTAAGALLLLMLWRRTRRCQALLTAAVTLLVSTGSVQLIKVVFRRPRPAWYPWLTEAHGFSFPSGHTLSAIMIAGLAFWTFRRAGQTGRNITIAVALTVWALAVAFSRVFLGVHYGSDIAASAALGLFFLSIFFLAPAFRDSQIQPALVRDRD
jgi:undecaprenyl-diphosphatase